MIGANGAWRRALALRSSCDGQRWGQRPRSGVPRTSTIQTSAQNLADMVTAIRSVGLQMLVLNASTGDEIDAAFAIPPPVESTRFWLVLMRRLTAGECNWLNSRRSIGFGVQEADMWPRTPEG